MRGLLKHALKHAWSMTWLLCAGLVGWWMAVEGRSTWDIVDAYMLGTVLAIFGGLVVYVACYGWAWRKLWERQDRTRALESQPQSGETAIVDEPEPDARDDPSDIKQVPSSMSIWYGGGNVALSIRREDRPGAQIIEMDVDSAKQLATSIFGAAERADVDAPEEGPCTH